MLRRLLVAVATTLLLSALPLLVHAQSEPTPVTTGELYSAGQQSAAKGDFVAAARWWQKGATLGSKDSARELGRLYTQGANGVPQNVAWAREWLGRAAEKGDAQAQALLKELDSPSFTRPAPVPPPVAVAPAAPSAPTAAMTPPRQVAVVNTLPAGAQAMPMIGSSTGPVRTLVCGQGERMVGVNYRAGDWIDRVQIICAPYNGLSRGNPHAGPSAGGAGGTTDIDAFCGKWDQNAWVMSVGAVAIENVVADGAAPQTFVARANLWCLTPKGSPVGVGPGNLQPKAQYVHSGKQNSSCPKDTPAVGLQVRGENYINAVGIICEGKALSQAMADYKAQLDAIANPPQRAQQQTYSSGGGSSSGSGGKSMADQMMETSKRQRQERCTAWLNNPNRGKFASPC
ncbi:MAG TPA: hypothetical protein VK996_01685 [Ramlibacter sp.]|nr:hypothetical protein [Ramlibacter sp.]